MWIARPWGGEEAGRVTIITVTDGYDTFFADNEANWDDRAKVHVLSDMYDVDTLISDPTHIEACVAIDRERLGDISGKDVVHLQCHLGTDTLCFDRMGARRVVGLDLSGESLRLGADIVRRAGARVEFVKANVYDAVEALTADCDEARFDLVYTGIGALGWLPDLTRWGQVVAGLMRPGGRFFIREDHPVSLMFADEVAAGLRVGYDYFNTGVLSDDEEGSYTDMPEDAPVIANQRSHWWNHSLQEIMMALIDAGLVVDAFEEHEYAMWPRFGEASVKVAPAQYAAPDGNPKVPLTFTLSAHKPLSTSVSN